MDITRVGTNVITATAGSSSASATLIVGRADIAPTGLTNCLGSTNVFSLTADSSADVLWELEPADAGPVFEGGTNSGTPVSILSGPHGASVTLKAYMNGLDSCFDTANLTIVEAESLTPSGGDPLPPDDADSPTRATLWAPPPEVGPPYLVTFLADYSPPGLPVGQLPGCWQWTTTGPGIVEPDPYDPLRRYVNVSVPGTNDLAVEAGSSSNFCRFIVVKVDVQQTNVYTCLTGTNMVTNTFSLTEDSFTNVTWSIDPDLSTNGGAFFAGTNVGATVEIASGTNGGIYRITATSDFYPDATDTATLTVFKTEVKSVIFTTDHGVLTDYNTNYAGEGGTVFSPRGWRKFPLTNNPVTHTKGQSVGVNVVISVAPGDLTYDLAGESGSPALSFHSTGITSSGGDQTLAMTADTNLPPQIDILNNSVVWTVTINSTHTCDAGTSGPHKIYVLWDSPTTTTEPTIKRIDWVCTLAQGQDTLDKIGDTVGPDATAHSRFDPNNSIFGGMTNAWQVMDGTSADCGTLSTLMKYELDLLGATGSAVKYVYARHASWSGLVSDSPSFSVMEHRVPGDNNTRLGFISGGWNNYEGCCLFRSKYWMGGAGAAETKAVDVLHHWVDPNTAATGNHQCYFDQQNQVVPYAPPPEPTY